MKILSAFDGISCAQVALNKANIKVDEYFASEIDKSAIKIAQHNFPNTIQLGDVKKIDTDSLPKIDLLIGGFPCQSFSIAGHRKGLDDYRGQLIYDLMNLKNRLNPTYFIFENVASMSRANKDALSNIIGTDYIVIDAGLLSAQSRKRCFWTNLQCNQPDNIGLFLRDILEPRQNCLDITDRMFAKREGTLAYTKTWSAVRTPDQKARVLTASGQRITNSGATNVKVGDRYYRLSEIECERLMGLPDGYTNVCGVSATARYRAIGNGFHVDVVAHIMQNMNTDTNYKI